jgi:outer membrane protein OmpA-like peptidoglycan-associated protein
MTVYSKRAALVFGASTAVLCLTMPAIAQVTALTVPGLSLPKVATIPGEAPLVTGVTSTGSPAATAAVVAVPSGTIEQLVTGVEGGATSDAASLTNNGSTTIRSSATATNTAAQAIANASLSDGINQNIAGPYTDVSGTFLNSGSLTIGSVASATGATGPGEGNALGARATSSAIGGVHQEAVIEGNKTGTTTVSSTNSGTFTFSSAATASATDSASATSEMEEAVFLRAQGNGSGNVTATTTLANSGTIAAVSSATATSSALDATATAGAGGGEHGLFHIRSAVNGTGTDVGNATLTNNAGRSISVTSTANATALGNATATALGGDGFSTAEDSKGTIFLVQAQASGSDAGTANATFNNAGAISAAFTSRATSTGAGGSATAASISNGTIRQIVEAGGPETFVGRVGTATLTNAQSSSISIATTATATALGASSASALLGAAVLQNGEIIGVSNVNFTNAGSFSAGSTATASGAAATANAAAEGLRQAGVSIGGFNAAFANSGTFSVTTAATSTGTTGAASLSTALGYQVISEPLALNVGNSGTFSVNATASGNGTAKASATGMKLFANIDPTTLPPEEGGGGNGMGMGGGNGGTNGGHGGGEGETVPEDPFAGWTNLITGSVTNSGTLTVTATTVANLPSSLERAYTSDSVGVQFESAVNRATFTNTGTIRVSAATTGGTSRATGILVTDFALSPVVPVATDRMTIANNGGNIIARISTNGGTNWKRGTAIDTSAAPNPVDIRFSGTSSVYGNIKLGAPDTFAVTGGITSLDGIINPAGSAAVGSLSVSSGATLYLVDRPTDNANYDGPARVNVRGFTLASGSTLQLQLPSATLAPAAQSAYPTITADTAALAGANLRLVMNTPNGLYANAYLFNDVIDANTRTGTFASVVTNTGSVLLTPAAVYDAGNNVDLTLTRVAFGAVPGLTGNQTAVGNAIEAVYSPTQTGAYGTLLANLFLINNTGTYADALNQLSGAHYAGAMQAISNNSLQVNTMVSDQIDCAITRGGIEPCRDQEDGLRLWAMGGFNDARVDTDGNGFGHESDGSHALLGIDYTFSNFTIGAYGGYRKVKSTFDLYGGEVKADGYQIGLVAGYDSGNFYIRANGSYAELNGESRRTVGVLSTAGTITGAPDFRLTSIHAEAGGRIAVGETWLTPFLGLEYTRVKMNGFTEIGLAGANLAFADQSQNRTSFLAGVKWAGKLGMVIPEAKVAYRNDSDGFFSTTQRFVDAPGTALFTVNSPASKQDSVMAGFSLAALFSDKVTGRIGYQGRFASDLKDNAFYGSLVVRFGGAKAPVPAAAPPPPPPPAPPAPLPPCPPAAVTPGPFLVFFDWDKSLITAETASILDRAAEQYSATGQTSIVLAGHADRSGTEDYNMQLSQRRADAVKAYMASKGIAEAAMTTRTFGESRPLVETADGVREPQNRRVEMTYGGAPVPATGPCTPQ